MSFRVLPAALVCLCFFAGTAAWAQQQPEQGGVERRLAEMEKQLAQLLKEVQQLRKEIQTPPRADAPRQETKIFRLRNADAAAMTRILQDLFQGREGLTMRFVADARTNSLIVQGRTEQFQAIEAVLKILDEGGGREKPKRVEPDKKSAQPSEPLQAIQTRINELEVNLAQLKDRASWSERMVKLGFLSQSQAMVETMRLQQSLADLARAKAQLKLLTEALEKEDGPKK